MIRRTFQLLSGIGPWRERDLWARGFLDWDAFPPASSGKVALSRKLDDGLRARLGEAEEALAAGDLGRLARMLPARTHWRLYPRFASEAVFLDIEAEGPSAREPTVVGLFDRGGVRTFIRGQNLEELPEALAERALWVTFNGACFDLPVLRARFPRLQPPALHLDLRPFCRQVGLQGGLKQIERALGIARPPHLCGVDGWDAVLLWRAYQQTSDPAPLRWLVEYNLYDAFQLRSVAEAAYNRAVAALALGEPPLEVFQRGDILYDVSRLLLGLGGDGEAEPGLLERLRQPA